MHFLQKISILIIFQALFFHCLQAQEVSSLELENPDSWTMVLIPDPQSYVKFEHNQPIMDIITSWIKTNTDKLNIELVMCVGDLVNSNNAIDQLAESKYGGDQNAWQQWDAISSSFKKLDDKVPYILCTGNHDMETKLGETRYSQFNSWFPPNGNPRNWDLLAGMFPSASGVETLENAYYEFTSPHGVPFLIFSLEFFPRDAIVKQAITVSKQEKYKDYKGILLTHAYLNADNNRRTVENYKLKDGTTGEELWQRFVAPSKNIEMVFCGHVAGHSHKEHVGYRTDKNAGGKDVHQMLFNAQWEGGGPNGNGGDGWIRILEFLPDQKTVLVKTFSPLFAISPETADKAFRTEDYDEFTLELD